MDALKKRILQDGKCFEGGILKVDSFINHQMDPMLMSLLNLQLLSWGLDGAVHTRS